MGYARQYQCDVRAIADASALFQNPIRLFFDYVLIAASIAISIQLNSLVVYVLVVFIIGSRMRALMNLLHECSHNNLILSNKKWNDAIGSIFCAFPIFMSRKQYTQDHMVHHLNFGNREKDPDLVRYIHCFSERAVSKTKLTRSEYLSEVLNLRNFVKYCYLYELSDTFSLPNSITGVAKLTIWLSILSGLYGLGYLEYLLLYWLVPYLTVFKVICYCAELLEHFGIYFEEKDVSRTRNIYTSPLVSFFIWPHGDNYHLNHHLFAFVPGYQLKNVDTYLRQHNETFATEGAFLYLQPASQLSPQN